MVRNPPLPRGDVTTSAAAPLIVTAELPRDIYALAEGLRRRHYPPERNQVAAHVALFPGLAIILLVFGLNLFQDGLRQVLDPKLQDR